MKSFFIKNTNKQYSIREDGQVISLKYVKHKILTPNKRNQVTLLIDNKIIYKSINVLLYDAFKTRKCIQCNNIFNTSSSTKWLCDKCTIINKQQTAIKSNTKNKLKRQRRTYIYNKRRVDSLHDSYINHSLGYKPNTLSQEIITAKRQQLLLHRQLKTI